MFAQLTEKNFCRLNGLLSLMVFQIRALIISIFGKESASIFSKKREDKYFGLNSMFVSVIIKSQETGSPPKRGFIILVIPSPTKEAKCVPAATSETLIAYFAN